MVFCLDDNGKVVLSIPSSHAFAVDAFDEHFLAAALHHLEKFGFVLQRNLSHHLAALGLYFLWNLVWHHGRFGTGAHRVFEGVDVAETDLLCKGAALLEGGLVLAREAYDDVGGEVEVGTEGLDALAHLAELCDGVEPVHAFQSVVGTTLQTNMHMRSQLLVLEQPQEMVAELVGFDGGDAHAEVAVDFKDVLYELLERSVFILVTSHVDSRQHDLLESVGNDFSDVVVDVVGRTTG